jgi:hypothetical protein
MTGEAALPVPEPVKAHTIPVWRAPDQEFFEHDDDDSSESSEETALKTDDDEETMGTECDEPSGERTNGRYGQFVTPHPDIYRTPSKRSNSSGASNSLHLPVSPAATMRNSFFTSRSELQLDNVMFPDADGSQISTAVPTPRILFPGGEGEEDDAEEAARRSEVVQSLAMLGHEQVARNRSRSRQPIADACSGHLRVSHAMPDWKPRPLPLSAPPSLGLRKAPDVPWCLESFPIQGYPFMSDMNHRDRRDSDKTLNDELAHYLKPRQALSSFAM